MGLTNDNRPDQRGSFGTGFDSSESFGTGSGSSKNPGSTDWQSKDQVSSDEEQPLGEDAEVDDEDEESEARGGLQPR